MDVYGDFQQVPRSLFMSFVLFAQEIQVQVHEGVTNDDSPHVSQNTFLPLSTQPGTPLVTVTTPQPQSDDYVTLTHKKLQFPTTVVSSSSGENTCSFF